MDYRIKPGYEVSLNKESKKVSVNGQESAWKPVTSDIPQGSVLGPMLFVHFIDDLPEYLRNNSDLYLYADDTKISRSIGDDNDETLLQEDIYTMNEWTEKWLLKFHPDKCKTMHLGHNENPKQLQTWRGASVHGEE